MYSIAAIACDAGDGLTACPGTGVGGGWVLRIEPMMKNNIPIPIAEMNSDNFRPRVSTKKKTKIAVAATWWFLSYFTIQRHARRRTLTTP